MVKKLKVKVLNIEDDFMDSTTRMFKWIGWSLTSHIDQSKIYNKAVYVCRLAYLFTTNCLILFGFVLETIYCFKQVGQPDALVKITNTALIMGFVVISVTKAYAVVYKNAKSLIEILDRLNQLFPKTIEEQEKYGVKQISDNLRRKCKVFIHFNIIGIWIYNLTPIIVQFYGLIVEGHFYPKTLPSVMYHFVDPFQPIVYEITYFTISWTGFTLSVTILATDLLYCTIVTLLSMQFDILAQKIRDISHIQKDQAVDDIKRFIKVHQELIDLAAKIENIFSPSFLLNVFSSTIVICLTGFQVFARTLAGHDQFNLLRCFYLLCPSLLEIFLLCFFSEKLIDSSSNVAVAAYDNNWYEANVTIEFKKCLLQVMIQSQKSQFITAYKFMKMSLVTCSTIFQSAYSYFTILRTLYG